MSTKLSTINIGPGGLASIARFPEQLLICEGFIASKTGHDTCEDALFINPHYVAVFDGMSDGGLGGKGRVRRAVQAIIARLSELPADLDAEQLFAELSTAVGPHASADAGPFGVAAAIYSVARSQIWRVGDIHLRIRTSHPEDLVLLGVKEVDEAMTEYRAAVNLAHLAKGLSPAEILESDPGLQACRELLAHQNALANTTGKFGYGTLNGTAIPSHLIEKIDVPAAATVVLTTDGYLSPELSLHQAEKNLRTAMENDPLALNELKGMGKCLIPNNLAPDDRTYLRFETK